MSQAAAPIERVQDMDLPDEGYFLMLLEPTESMTSVETAGLAHVGNAIKDLGGERSEEILAHLKPAGIQMFARDIVMAVYKSQQTGDFRALQDVIEAWYRSLRFIRDPGFREAVTGQEALQAKGERRVFESDEIRERLGL
jgi:hypothetical protein